MVKSTIVLPNLNNEKVLPLCFQYLKNNIDVSQHDFIVVDDGSTDNSLQILKEELPWIGFHKYTLIEQKHKGIVCALNAACKEVKTEFIIRIDGDATVETPGWDKRMINLMESNKKIGMVGGTVEFDNGIVHSLGRSVFSKEGLYDIGTIPLELPGHRTFDSIVRRVPFKSVRINNLPYEVDTVLGVCVMFRKEDYDITGGFDVNYSPVWIEDDDFGIMMRKLDKINVIDPFVHIVHRVSLRGTRNVLSVYKQKKKVFSFKASTKKMIKNLLQPIIDDSRFNDYKKRINESIQLPKEGNAWRREVLLSHYNYWETKWGFNPINPDMEKVMSLYPKFCELRIKQNWFQLLKADVV